MAFSLVSNLFEQRTSTISDSDISHYCENFLRSRLYSETVYCLARRLGKELIIRVHSPLLAERSILLSRDLQVSAQQDLNCDIQRIRVMLE